MKATQENIFGKQLIACCIDPLTGYLRDGYCKNTAQDTGTHILCARMTENFLSYTKSRGNDLTTPIPHWNFPGLKPGDFWCLCISRWLQAEKAGNAPPLKLEACHISALKYMTIEVLKKYEYKESL